MRFIHTADLHLGKRLNDVPLIEDQVYILGEIRRIAREERAQAVIIAGDIYQSSSPQAEAMSAFNDFVTALAEDGTAVLAISGNHDSARRVSYLSALVRARGVYVSEEFTGTLQKVELEDEHGRIVVSLLPFVKPVSVRRCFPDEEIETCQDAVAAVLRHSPLDGGARNVLVCHQFVTGAQESGSEELYAGGLECVDGRLFDGFDYVAMGHIHRAQRVGRDTVRYAGSPLKYSFSEAAHKKSVTVVDMGEKGSVQIKLVPLTPLHELREVEGYMEELMAAPYSEDYVHITLRDELVPPDARVTLSTVFPNMLRFGVKNSKTAEDEQEIVQQDVETKSVEELFCDFYALQNNGAQPAEEQLGLLRQILREEGGAEE